MPTPNPVRQHQSKLSRPEHPRWWSEQHTLLWEESRSPLRDDFERAAERKREQMKHLGPDDSVFQAHPETPRNVDIEHAHTVADDGWELGSDWDEIEAGVRFGVGARAQYPEYDRWSDEVETRLRSEWNDTNEPSSWEKLKRAVRRGFEFIKPAP